MTAPLLTVADVHAGYLPGVDILRGISIAARPNEITLVIGPNGAGKSTLLRTVFAFLAPNQGAITFRERATAGLRPSDLKAAGISYVTQDINSFPGLTVEENLHMGAWVFRRDSERLRRQLERAYATFPALADKRRARAGELSGGQGRMLSVAREMMTEPHSSAGRRANRGACSQSGRAGLRHPADGEEVERGCDPAGRAERRTGASARRSSLSSQSRPGEGGRAGSGIRQRARLGH